MLIVNWATGGLGNLYYGQPMDIEEIDLGATVARSCLQGSKRLVVSFEFMPLGEVPYRQAWAQDFVANAGWDGLFMMPMVLDWYQDQVIWDFFDAMQSSGFFEAYESVVTYGNSLGGFAALAFASMCNAERVVAIQPRVTLRRAMPWPSEMSENLVYPRNGEHANALVDLQDDVEILVFADPYSARDWAHASCVPAAKLFEVPLVGHEIPDFLLELGVFGQVARRAIAGQLDEGWFANVMQAKAQSRIYQRVLAAELRRRGKAEGAVVQQGIGQFGPDPKAE